MTKHTPWYTLCRTAQERWKATTTQLPDDARRPGLCVVEQNGKRVTVGPFPICLPEPNAHLNLLAEIRTDALELFAHQDIEWHHYTEHPTGVRWPTTHLLDSQVQCVNVFLSLSRRPGALLDFAREIVPGATWVVPVEEDRPVAFEWSGLRDHLGESHGRPRQRGRYATSIDAFLVVEAPQGRTAVLVEWKFTESYRHPVNPISKWGTDRRKTYRGAFEAESSPIDHAASLDAFFHEPYYQLLRLHLLAASIVRDREFGVDSAVVVLALPNDNEDLHARVPAGLQNFGGRLTEVWSRLVRHPTISFRTIDSQQFLSASEPLAERYGERGRVPFSQNGGSGSV
jgi:hypothetical protein